MRLYTPFIHRLQPGISDLALDLLLGDDDGNVVRLDRVVGLGAGGKLGRHLGVALGDSLAVGETLVAAASGDDSVAKVSLVSSVLVEDLQTLV